MSTPEVRSVFNHLEELRRKARLSQVDVAALANVTRRSYTAWGLGRTIQDDRLADLKYAVFIIEQGMKKGELPIHGHDRRPDTAERRREVIAQLTACYPHNPYRMEA